MASTNPAHADVNHNQYPKTASPTRKDYDEVHNQYPKTASPTRKDYDDNVHPDIQKERLQKAKKKEKREEHREKLLDKLDQEAEDKEVIKEYKTKGSPRRGHKEAGPIENIGRNVSGYVAKNVGAPVWMDTGGGGGRAAPPAWIAGSYGGGKLPAWVMGGPAPWEPPVKKAAPRRIRSVPKTPKSTRPAWMRW
jgi:hypothetical protein